MNISTHSQPVSAELRLWIVAQAEAGCRPEDLLASMRTSGWAEDVAIEALESTLTQRLEQLGLPLPGAAAPLPEPALDRQPATIFALDREVQIISTLRLPRVVVLGGLLAIEECEGLMALSRTRLARSQTVDNQTGGSEVNAARTSDGMFFERGEFALIDRIERRIAALINWPLDHGEGLQVLRYGPGAEYRPHYDYFDVAQPSAATILQRGGQRVGTLIMYLSTPQRGGATVFPDAGLEVLPVQGNAVFFSYDRPHPATHTLHGGAPVLDGEKWVATKWLRERVFV